MNIKVSNIRVLTGRNGPDIIWMDTEFPDGCYPFEDTAILEMKVAHKTGVEYVKKHFGVEPEVIDGA